VLVSCLFVCLFVIFSRVCFSRPGPAPGVDRTNNIHTQPHLTLPKTTTTTTTRVGAATETELKDKKLRYEDAINSVKSAIEMGVLPGGGTALIYLSQTMRAEILATFGEEEKEQRRGAEILLKAMEEPIRQIAFNSGFTPGRVLEQVKERGEWGWGLNAASGKFENLLETGVLDSASVVLNAITNSASVASLVLTTECVITERDKVPGM
jgi:chaperonin GroEL